VKAGLANAKRRGREVGRPRATVNIVKVHEMAATGVSARAIAKAIGVSDYTMRQILSMRENPSGDAPSNAHDFAPPAVAISPRVKEKIFTRWPHRSASLLPALCLFFPATHCRVHPLAEMTT
jgi:hypothetical protein